MFVLDQKEIIIIILLKIVGISKKTHHIWLINKQKNAYSTILLFINLNRYKSFNPQMYLQLWRVKKLLMAY